MDATLNICHQNDKINHAFMPDAEGPGNLQGDKNALKIWRVSIKQCKQGTEFSFEEPIRRKPYVP